MTSLQALWDAALSLSATGSLALATLLLARVIARGRGERRLEARARILPVLLGAGGAPHRLSGLDLQVATRLTCELAELTRGSDLSDLLLRASDMGVPGMLVRWLRARSPQKRLTAVETLGLFPVEGGQVTAALDDRNRDVRLGAALILAQRDDAPSVGTLVKKLRIGADEHSLLIVTLMIDCANRDPDSVAALLTDDDIPYEAKVAATDALADSGGRYASLLAQMAQELDGEPQFQQRIFRALGRTGHPAGADAIIAGLSAKDPTVRAAAAEAAGRAGLTQASESLGELLADAEWAVRYRAAGALLRLGRQGNSALSHAAAGENVEARLAARTMLAEARAA